MQDLKQWIVYATIVAVSLAVSASKSTGQSTAREPAKAAMAPTEEAKSADAEINRLRDRIKARPKDFASYTALSELLTRRAKVSGDLEAFEVAETTARNALDLSPNDTRATIALITALCERKKFGEAQVLVRRQFAKRPNSLQLLMRIGDSALELGDFAEAERAYRTVVRREPQPPAFVRMARLLELQGKPDEARSYLERAETLAGKVRDENIIWYRLQHGNLEFNRGRMAEAESIYTALMHENPEFRPAVTGLARVRGAAGRYEDALGLYKKALLIGRSPSLFAAIGDLFAKTGKREEAERTYEILEVECAEFREFRRELAMFYADHDQRLPEALDLAESDVRERKDVYAYDALAWTLAKNNRFNEAERAMRKALALGTSDASLFYHSGIIYRGLGQQEKARTNLERALAINPGFSVLQAEVARKALADLNENAKASTEHPDTNR
jgi:tetratricopeptide (TPR) repeat protein